MQSRIKRVSTKRPLTRPSPSQTHESTFPSKIRQAVEKVNFQGAPFLVLFWKCNPASDSEENDCFLTVKGQPFLLTQPHIELVLYQRGCDTMDGRFVGQNTKVENWLVGRAVQTKVADQGTKRNHFSGRTLGLLVLPVFSHGVTHKELEGIIEVVTIEPKGSYEEEFVHIHNLLKFEGLESMCMGKTIKVKFNNDIIKFTLSLSAKLEDLQKEVRKRFKKLEDKTFSIKYEDTNGNRLPLLSDHNLMLCLNESVSTEMTVIRMFLKPVA